MFVEGWIQLLYEISQQNHPRVRCKEVLKLKTFASAFLASLFVCGFILFMFAHLIFSNIFVMAIFISLLLAGLITAIMEQESRITVLEKTVEQSLKKETNIN